MAQNDIESVIQSFKEEGHFMDRSVSDRTLARHRRIEAAPEDVRRLLDQGFPMEFVERLARLAKEK